jgi:hypothetical protein
MGRLVQPLHLHVRIGHLVRLSVALGSKLLPNGWAWLGGEGRPEQRRRRRGGFLVDGFPVFA